MKPFSGRMETRSRVSSELPTRAGQKAMYRRLSVPVPRTYVARPTTTTRNTPKNNVDIVRELSLTKLYALSTHGQTRFLDSMHACLNVDEIVRLIAYELVASEGKATNVALACCRKSFEDPVLDALWVKQYRLLPLLKSFPGDVWNDEKCTVSTPTTWFFLFLMVRLESLSKESRRRRNGLVSESTLEGCERSVNLAL